MEEKLNKMDNICRLCLAYINEIPAVLSTATPLLQKINYFLRIQIVLQDSFPNGVCRKCLDFIKELNKFQTSVRLSECKLKKLSINGGLGDYYRKCYPKLYKYENYETDNPGINDKNIDNQSIIAKESANVKIETDKDNDNDIIIIPDTCIFVDISDENKIKDNNCLENEDENTKNITVKEFDTVNVKIETDIDNENDIIIIPETCMDICDENKIKDDNSLDNDDENTKNIDNQNVTAKEFNTVKIKIETNAHNKLDNINIPEVCIEFEDNVVPDNNDKDLKTKNNSINDNLQDNTTHEISDETSQNQIKIKTEPSNTIANLNDEIKQTKNLKRKYSKIIRSAKKTVNTRTSSKMNKIYSQENGLMNFEPIVKIKTANDHSDEEMLPDKLMVIENYFYYFDCLMCEEQLENKEDLIQHYNNNHGESEIEKSILTTENLEYICKICNKNNRRNKKLAIKHLLKHDIGLFICKICDKSYKSVLEIVEHGKAHNAKGPYSCGACSFCTSNEEDLKIHQHSHVINGDKSFICDHCPKRFVTSTNLEKHMFVHTGVGPICKYCQQAFPYESERNRHIFYTHPEAVENDKYKCMKCEKKFLDKSNLLEHIKVDHYVKRYLCQICGQRFTYSHTLLNHTRRIHASAKPFKCRKCNKSFVCREYLVGHQRVHSGEKPFICKYCGSRFTQRTPLRLHIRYHTGEKPYKCNICTEAFVSKIKLIKHQQRCP